MLAARSRTVAALVAAVIAVASCSGPGGSPSPSATRLTVGLGFIPNVQFAQFYLAQQAGYYRDAGLEVTFQNDTDPNLIPLVAQGQVDIGITDGTSLVPAVSQGLPVRYVATIYADFPNVVFAKASSGITTAADLKDRRLGTPGQYGSSWIMLQAMLADADLTPADLEVITYPDYSQGAAVARDQVDAATGFFNNEPIQLQRGGDEPVVLRIDDVVALPGNGLIVGEGTLAARKPALAAFVAATLRAMSEIIADPTTGLDAAIATVPDLGQDRELQRAILEATVDAWQNDRTARDGLGAIDRDGWTASIELMSKLPGGLVPNAVTADDIVSEELLPR